MGPETVGMPNPELQGRQLIDDVAAEFNDLSAAEQEMFWSEVDKNMDLLDRRISDSSDAESMTREDANATSQRSAIGVIRRGPHRPIEVK